MWKCRVWLRLAMLNEADESWLKLDPVKESRALGSLPRPEIPS